MAQLTGTFKDKETAIHAAQKLRAMDIPDEDIVVSQEGKGDDSHFLLTADVADWQMSAAQAVVNAAVGTSGQIQPGSAVSAASDESSDEDSAVYIGGMRTDDDEAPGPGIVAMAGPGVIGSGTVGGPAALTARAAAIGSADELADETLDRDNPDTQGDSINSVSPR